MFHVVLAPMLMPNKTASVMRNANENTEKADAWNACRF
jgi:hypothetical protein